MVLLFFLAYGVEQNVNNDRYMLLYHALFAGDLRDHIHFLRSIYIAIKLDKIYFCHASSIIKALTQIRKRKLYNTLHDTLHGTR